MILGKRSRERLVGVHPDLIIVMATAIQRTEIDFAVIEGVRTLKRQKELLAAGASKTLKSRHLTGHAVDIAPWVHGEIRWDWPLYNTLSKTVKQAAKDCGIHIEWGGDWKSFKDGPHWQLPWKEYPA
jgi:peptidoglycan L-alanyl-D-glutamate endopeptidase CwlK